VLATETVDEAALRDVAALGLDGESPADVLVIAPALNSRLRHWLSDEDEARRHAGVSLAVSLEQLRAAGIAAQGLVGDADPLQAIADALYQFGSREIVIATQPEGCSHWLTRDLVRRARRRFAEPVVHVSLEPEPRDGSDRPGITAGLPVSSALETSATRKGTGRMLPHPETHLQIARQRHQASVARAARHPLATSSPRSTAPRRRLAARAAALARLALSRNARVLRNGRERPCEADAKT
jgi:hypothetical protein